MAAREDDDAALLRTRARELRALTRRRLGLWRALARDNLLFPRKLTMTSEGRWMIGLTVLLGVGAVNTGNNLLYLALSLLISIISISGVLSELTLRGLVVERLPVPSLELGTASLLRYQVSAPRRRAALHLQIAEVIDDAALRQRPAELLHLAAGETTTAVAVTVPARRGPIATSGLQIATTHPFGFARKAILVPIPAQLLVLPATLPLSCALPPGLGRGQDVRAGRAGSGAELRGLRDLRPGDAPRDVHWKVSARRGRGITREWEEEASREVEVAFVHLAPPGAGAAGTVDDERFDRACASVAGLCAALLDQGMAVGLRTFVGAVPPRPHGDGSQLRELRHHLAWLLAADRPPPLDWAAPSPDWLAATRRSEQVAAAIAAGRPLALAAGAATAATRVWVRWRDHPATTIASGERARLVAWLSADGTIDSVQEQRGAPSAEAA